MNKTRKIGITLGDYNGIGTEITIKALQRLGISSQNVLIIGNKKIFELFETKHGLSFPGDFEVLEVPFDENDYNPGKETAAAGEFSYRCLEHACGLAKQGRISAIVTAPVSKNTMQLAGHDFSGQTEVIEHFLAHDGQRAEMLFAARDFRVMLLTRHVPLACVRVTKDLIIEKVLRLNEALKNNFAIHRPSIALCALNPHAGEKGILGMDEREEMVPAVSALCEAGVNITLPVPADTLFSKAASEYRYGAQSYDCYVACYHDQGLIPIKALAMDECVNMTIGLDILRTSPAHGTAYDIAEFCCARPDSMVAAIEAAIAQA